MIRNLSPTRIPNDEGKNLHGLEVMANELTFANLVNLTISTADLERASDIHSVPFENYLQLRYRVDGLCRRSLPRRGNFTPRLSRASESSRT